MPEEDHTILRDNEPEYTGHAAEIEELKEEAEQRGMLPKNIHDQVISPEGIVCDRTGKETEFSVRKLFSANANQVLTNESYFATQQQKIPPEFIEERKFVERVLATHLSIQQHRNGLAGEFSANDTVKKHQALVDSLESFCKKNGIPSLLPYLFSPTELFTTLLEGEYQKVIDEKNGKQFLERIAGLFQHQPEYLYALVASQSRTGKSDRALSLIDTIIQWRNIPIQQFWRENSRVGQHCAQLYFAKENYDAVISIWESVQPTPGSADIQPDFTSAYLRSLIAKDEIEKASQFIMQFDLKTEYPNSTLSTAIKDACVSVGWWMYGKGEDTQILSLLACRCYSAVMANDKDVHDLYSQVGANMIPGKSRNKKT